MVRTRFAPSPTGYLHIGGARTALFSWAYARRHGGEFVLRIEDTDLERSTETSTQAILASMEWLGLGWEEGPFYQMQRLERYRAIADDLIRAGHAYYCYASKDELDAMREAQRMRGEKPRYDGRWRPENVVGKKPPTGVDPVVRFKTPLEGEVTFNDLVKGPITVANTELDDLVILRADGVPTYNFGVVVDDLDMRITHVIRGDDHVNNTPRQVNIFRALGVDLPHFAHVPMILGADGERLSKRHGAVSVTQYRDEGYLPEALNNYLARLGWSHGDEEVFSLAQFVEWFDLEHISRSAAQFNPEKLAWLNQQYLKQADDSRLAALVLPSLARRGIPVADDDPRLPAVMALVKERSSTVEQIADQAVYFFHCIEPSDALKQQHYTAEALPAIEELMQSFETLEWSRAAIGEAVKRQVQRSGLKTPKVMMPLRVMVTGEAQTPSLDAVLEIVGREETLARMRAQLPAFPGA
jgi:glutamyl-tRNA synthetase